MVTKITPRAGGDFDDKAQRVARASERTAVSILESANEDGGYGLGLVLLFVSWVEAGVLRAIPTIACEDRQQMARLPGLLRGLADSIEQGQVDEGGVPMSPGGDA